MSTFFETIFLKDDSAMDKKIEYLKSLGKSDQNMIKGSYGEKQVSYHLSKANIGMYVMRDINLECDDLKAQIDFVVVTSHHCYFIECKNYNADIIHVNEFGNFEESTRYGKKYNKNSINSPISQVEDQLAVFKKICLKEQNRIKDKFNNYFKTMVVFTNPDNRLNLKKAPNDIKYRVLKVDNLIRQIEYDEKHYNGKNYTQEQMKQIADFILSKNVEVKVEDIPTTSFYESESTSATSNYAYSHNHRNSKRSDKRLSSEIIRGLGSVLLVIFVLVIISAVFSNKNSDNKSILGDRQKTLSKNNIEAINNLKEAYNSSKENGFDLYNYDQCKYLKELLPNLFNCSGLPMQVEFSGDNNLSIYKTYTCYYLKYDLSDKKIIEVSSKYVGYDNKCPGIDVGFINYDPNNEYLAKIGGYDKVLEMARFAHNNNSGFDNYYDYSHIEERGGNPSLYSTYKMKVDGYFGTISNKGNVIYDNTLDDFNTIVEYYYYIMK